MSLKSISCALATAALLAAASQVSAMEPMPPTRVSMEECLSVALERYPGKVKELEFGLEDGVPHYEFEILTADGRETEVECSAMTGEIVEVEWENENMDLDAFLEISKVSPAQARKIALRRVPGKVTKMDLETNSMGVMSYEFEIRTRDGEDVDVEVDAMSGNVIEVETEVYEVGDVCD
jgi:uncharacterized membrane protein YkoI